MISRTFYSIFQLPNLDDVFISINSLIEILFGYLKYVFFGILLIIGILTLFALRGKFLLERIRYSKEN